jgi:hypothetical protein
MTLHLSLQGEVGRSPGEVAEFDERDEIWDELDLAGAQQ